MTASGAGGDPGDFPPIEQTLALLAEKDYWVSNVFQTWGDGAGRGTGEGWVFGPNPGWKVCLRNRSTTQTAIAEAETLAAALAEALRKAEATPGYRSGHRQEAPGAQKPGRPARFERPLPIVILAVDASEDEGEDPF